MGKSHGIPGVTDICRFEEATNGDVRLQEDIFQNTIITPADSPYKLYRATMDTVPVEPLNVEVVTENQEGLNLYWQDRELKVWSYPTRSVTIPQIRGHVDDETQKTGWKPKVLIWDYPRILGSNSTDEYRIRLEQNWIDIKQWAGETESTHVGGLQVTGDMLHTGRKPNLSSIPEAKAISTHLAQIFALWDAPGDESQKLMRASALKTRYAERTGKDAVVSYSYSIGQPHLSSILSNQLSI